MKLASVQVTNFRSIADLTLEFNHACQCLIGINESGKTNILRALHLLDKSVGTSAADLRIERHDEPPVQTGLVRFVFQLQEDEIDNVFVELKKHFSPSCLEKELVISKNKKWNLSQYCHHVREGLYKVEIPSGTRTYTIWTRPVSEVIADNWYRSKSTGSIEINLLDGSSVSVPEGGFVWIPPGTNFDENAFAKLEIRDVVNIHSSLIRKHVENNLPVCIFWKYADKYLLPSSIDVAEFCSNPDSCVPLKSMFELAGYDANSLATVITSAQAQGHYRYTQILEKTAAKATEHIRKIWSDYKNVRIRLDSHGATLAPMIVDDVVPLDMINRSDGFKRFVSFLLQVSAKVRTEEICNALILIDEPEIALHPSGAKSLMRELIEIGNSNAVIYSTHSIFMIDKNEIGRHLVVEKKKEVTTTWRAEKSRIQDEEVLYSAIGFSIFEALKENNVIFEGWRDKKLFEVMAAAIAKTDDDVKTKLLGVGFTFAEGVKDVRNVARFLELASRPCLVISDADQVALQHKKAYLIPGAWGEWKTLKDILPGSSVVTAEDLITKSALVKKANKFRGTVAGLPALTEEFFHAGEAALIGLHRWLEGAGLANKELEEKLNELKSVIFDELKRIDISEEAIELVKYVANFNFTGQIDQGA